MITMMYHYIITELDIIDNAINRDRTHYNRNLDEIIGPFSFLSSPVLII